MYKISDYYSWRYVINIILASTSPYRKSLLERLGIPFSTQAPGVNEVRQNNESAEDMALRLANEKANAVAHNVQGALVIGSDQTLACDDEILGKPLSADKASQQLRMMRGKTLVFHTGLAVVNTNSRKTYADVIQCLVKFRHLGDKEIDRYLEKEQPFNCAGSFKSEAMGISLLESLEGTDPTALVGLPLIRLSEILRQEGLDIP